jgi:hypothetical protein
MQLQFHGGGIALKYPQDILRFLLLLFFTGSSERKAEPEIRWIFGSAKISSGYFKGRSLFASFSLSQIWEKKKPFTYIAKQYSNVF